MEAQTCGTINVKPALLELLKSVNDLNIPIGIYFKRRSKQQGCANKLQIWPLYMWARIKDAGFWLE
jgi:hypothetical protein